MAEGEDDGRNLGRRIRFGDGTFLPAVTPRVVERGDSNEPVSEDLVQEETDGIFRSFVQNMQANELQLEESDETPTFSELAFGDTGPFSSVFKFCINKQKKLCFF